MRRSFPLLAAALLSLGLLGCGTPRAPRPAGDYQALRLRRDVPPQGRLTREDVELVAVKAGSLPRPEARPRSIEEVLGAAVRTQQRAGVFLLDELLDHHPISPEAGASELWQGELGLVAEIEALPWEAQPGQFLKVSEIPFPVRLARVSPPSREKRQILLGAPEEAFLKALHDIPRYPLQYQETVDCAREACHREVLPVPPAIREGDSQEVHVVTRELETGHRLVAEDLVPQRIPSRLLPAEAVPSVKLVVGATTTQPLFPGEVLREELLTKQESPPEGVELFVPGLYPDWLHPGGRAYFLRAHAEGAPTAMDVLDMDRAPLGSPIPVLARPRLGLDWPRVHRGKKHTHDHGESGHEAWVMVLRR